MTRRTLLALLAAAARAADGPVVLPVRVLRDSRARFAPGEFEKFTDAIWPEAVRDFARAGIRLDPVWASGEMGRAPSDRPIFKGLAAGVLNVVLTSEIPLAWDRARRPRAVTTQYDGHHLCLIAVPRAHGHQVPFLSVNTVVHEFLHVLLGDIYERRPDGWEGEHRELRVDWFATRLWLFGDGAEIQRRAAAYIASRRPQ
jgi:hypothetical protein